MATVESRHGVDRTIGADCFRLNLFGDFLLSTPDGVVVTGLSRKAKGLIAYLALSRGNASRDELATLLWSDRDVSQARASLRQVCYELRHTLPNASPVLVSCGRDFIAIDREHLVTDIELLDATGNDLDGLHAAMHPAKALLLRDLSMLSSAFDDWLSVERIHRADERRTWVASIAHKAIADQRWSDAKRVATALLALDPTDADAARLAMQAVSETGDAAAAKQIYLRHADALRRDLDVSPCAETTTLLRNIAAGAVTRSRRPSIPWPGRKRVTVPVQVESLSVQRQATPLASFKRRWLALENRNRSAIIASVTLAVSALLGIGFHRAPSDTGVVLVRIDPLAADRDDREAQAISSGLRAVIAQNLVGSGTPVQVLDNGDTTPAPLIVRGSSSNDHGVLRANMELVSGQSGQILWAAKFDRPATELDQFEDQVGLQIARELYCAYANGRGPYFDRDPEMARLSLGHCDTLGRDADEAVRFDAQITSRVPGFARGWAEFATDLALAAKSLPPALRAAADARVRIYAKRALALNPREGLAYGALMLPLDSVTQWAERDQLAVRGIAAVPDEPMIHSFRYNALAEVGRLQDAMNEARLAFQLQHFLPGPISKLIDAETLLGDTQKAHDHLALAQRYWPHDRRFDKAALQLEATEGDPTEALKLLDVHNGRHQERAASYVRAFLMWRIAPSASTKSTAVRAIEMAAQNEGVTANHVQTLAYLGQIDAAYRLAERLPVSERLNANWFGAALAPFRANPRFMAFATHLGLTRIWQQTGRWPDFCSQQPLPYDCKTAARAALQYKNVDLAFSAEPGGQ